MSVTRRSALQAGAMGMAGLGLASLGAPAAWARPDRVPTVEDLGPGVTGIASLACLLVGERLYVGSRNANPARVIEYDVPSKTVVGEHHLATGNIVQGLASDGVHLYAGVTEAPWQDNLYAIELATGQVTPVGNVPGHYIRDLTMAPGGVLYAVGRPQPEHGDGPGLFACDPSTGEITRLATPVSDCDEGSAVTATETTVYYSCQSTLTDRTGRGIYAVDRTTGAVEQVHASNSYPHGLWVFGDLVGVNGTTWGFGTIDTADHSMRIYPDLQASRAVTRQGDTMVLVSNTELYRLDLITGASEYIGAPAHGNTRRAAVLGDLVVAAAGDGNVWTYDLATDETEQVDLVEAGATGTAMNTQSVGYGDGYAFVAGTAKVAVHDLASGTVEIVRAGAEVKDMVWADGVMWMASYSAGELYAYTPGQDAEPELVADFAPGFNRPFVACWDEVNRLVAVGVQNNAAGGGSLCLYSPDTGDLTEDIDPFGDAQFPRAIAVQDGIHYLGGSAGGVGTVLAWDPVAHQELWRVENPFEQAVSSLVACGKYLYGLTWPGTFFVLERSPTPQIVHSANIASVSGNQARLILDQGNLYGIGFDTFFGIDRDGYAPRVLVDGLDGQWFSGPRVDEGDHEFYTVSFQNLVRISVCPAPPRRG